MGYTCAGLPGDVQFAPWGHTCTAVLCLPAFGRSAMHVLQVASAAATLAAVVEYYSSIGMPSRPVTSADDLSPIQGCRYQGAETPF